MQINLKQMPYNGIDLDEPILFPSSYFESGYIIDIKNAHFKGHANITITEEIEVEGLLTGNMILEDARTLEPVPKPFEISINETITIEETRNRKEQNILDINPILWENIVLEVPIRFVKDESTPIQKKGDGWELMDNDE